MAFSVTAEGEEREPRAAKPTAEIRALFNQVRRHENAPDSRRMLNYGTSTRSGLLNLTCRRVFGYTPPPRRGKMVVERQ